MHLIVHKTFSFSGEARPPSSKSQTVRGILLALLAQGESVLSNVLDADDVQYAIAVVEGLGAKVTRNNDELHIFSAGIPLQPQQDSLFSGNSGITTRFIMPMLGFRQDTTRPIVLDCGAQMRGRSISTLTDALNRLGLDIQYLAQAGACPITVTGSLSGGKAEVDGLSSQYLSALLLSLPCAPNSSEIRVKNLHERPYMEMTLRWLKDLGMTYRHIRQGSTDVFRIAGGQRYTPFRKVISGDFSSASSLIAAAALSNSKVELHGLNMKEPQGDRQLVTILQKMGADIEVYPNRLLVHGGNVLEGIHIDANGIPDLLPTLAVVGTQARGRTVIHNVPQARIKETDRIHSMTQGLTRMGAKIEERAEGLAVYQSTLHGASVEGFDDHRTVMALALAGMHAEGATIISDAEAINKTFPTFVSMMQSLGAKMELSNEK